MEGEAGRKARDEASTEYRLEDIIKFIDELYDLSALTYNERAYGFSAHGKAWFKGKIHAYLRKLASADAQWAHTSYNLSQSFSNKKVLNNYHNQIFLTVANIR